MAVSAQQIVDFLIANPNMSDAEIASVMNQFGVSPADVATATGADEATIQARFEEAAPTVTAPVYEAPTAPVAPVYEAPPVAPTAPVAETKVSKEQIVNFLVTNPSLSDAEIVKTMETYKVSPADIAKATGSDEGKIAARVAATLPPNQVVLLGDTYVQAINETTGSGQDQQVGGLQNVITYKAGENKAGGSFNQYKPTGELEQKGVQQEVNANKDFAKFVLTAATLGGLPPAIGEALGLTGATANAVGTGLLSGGSAAIAGGDLKDIVKAGLVGGGASLLGSTVGDLVKPTIDASTLTSEELNDLINKGFSEDLKKAGVKNVSEFTTNVGGNAGTFYDAAGNPIVTTPTVTAPVTTPVAPVVSPDNLVITAPKAVTIPSISNVISAISTQLPDAGTVKVTDTKEKDKIVTPTIPTTPTTPTVPEITVTGPRPVVPATPIAPTVPTLPLVIPTIPTTPVKPVTPPEPPPKDKTPSITDIIKVIAPLVLAPAVVNSLTPTKPTYPIVPVPPEWTPPPVQPTTPFQPLTPIDFGNQNLLKGTQWEKFLDPNYGKVPAPTQYSQPSNLSYNDLMGILGSKQGMPPTSSLSINDVISGIQNQYGQVPSSAVGQKLA